MFRVALSRTKRCMAS